MSLKNKCLSVGCIKPTRFKIGYCIDHGDRKDTHLCRVPECSKKTANGGCCVDHGGVYNRTMCKTSGCVSRAWTYGTCFKHRDRTDVNVQKSEKFFKIKRKLTKCEFDGCQQYKSPHKMFCSKHLIKLNLICSERTNGFFLCSLPVILGTTRCKKCTFIN